MLAARPRKLTPHERRDAGETLIDIAHSTTFPFRPSAARDRPGGLFLGVKNFAVGREIASAACHFPTIRPGRRRGTCRCHRRPTSRAGIQVGSVGQAKKDICCGVRIKRPAEGGDRGGVPRHKSGLGNTGDAGAVSVGNADRRKAISRKVGLVVGAGPDRAAREACWKRIWPAGLPFKGAVRTSRQLPSQFRQHEPTTVNLRGLGDHEVVRSCRPVASG